ncbi:SDR family oxidoreductase [Streptomyces violaceus]|uniref:SDR family oxidoreductase n=1 Tax=Streptomyces violaceus TaxID=1936 RepID=A0ABZ1P7F5_STRVL
MPCQVTSASWSRWLETTAVWPGTWPRSVPRTRARWRRLPPRSCSVWRPSQTSATTRRPPTSSPNAPTTSVQAAALAWSRSGARVNTLSPGVIATAMAEADEDADGHMRKMLDACGAGRPGTPGEIADAVAFLTGPEARYITGTDLLVDGGQAAWIRRHMRRRPSSSPNAPSASTSATCS